MLLYLLREPLGLSLRDEFGRLDAIDDKAQLIGFKGRIIQKPALRFFVIGYIYLVVVSLYGVKVVINSFEARILKFLASVVFHYCLSRDRVLLVGVGIEKITQGKQSDRYLSSVVPVHRLPLRCWIDVIVAQSETEKKEYC
ncbi:MAG: hypothetical protein II881_09380 [Oscillospiraceae bacterium]|nr:hypothetical protein [Oscillospiraceae bacterium]